jgi:hypothetical protein
MKWMAVAWVACLLGVDVSVAATPPVLPPRYVVVKVTDFDKKEDHQVMTTDDLKTLNADLKKEALLFPRALVNAQKTWSQDPKYKGKFFPKTSLSPRKADQIGMQYPDQEKAQTKIDNMLDSASKREDRKAQQERQRESMQQRANRGMGGHAVNLSKKDSHTAAREKEKEDLIVEAADLVRAEIDKLKSETPAAGAPAAAGGAAGGANAQEPVQPDAKPAHPAKAGG